MNKKMIESNPSVKKLSKIVQHAAQNIEFYQQKYAGLDLEGEYSLHELPILTKNEIRIHGETMVDKRYDVKDLICDETSGTTGLPLRLYKSKHESTKIAMGMWKKRKEMGVTPKDRFVSNFGSILRESGAIETPFTKFGRNGNLQLSMLHQTSEAFDAFLEALKDYQPAWFHAVPSIVHLMAAYYEEQGIQAEVKNLKYIEASGELLHAPQRKLIEKVFGVPVRNNYAAQEFYMMAFECPHGHMHVLDNNVYVEICDEQGMPLPDGEEGDLIVTSLNNMAMPLIRYRLGDRGRYIPGICDCGDESPVLDVNCGRIEDYVVLPNGQMMHSIIFVVIAEWMDLKHPKAIIQLQAIQEKPNHLDVYVRVGTGWTDAAGEDLIQKIKEYLTDEMNCTLYPVQAALNKGKFKHFIRTF